MNSIMAPSARRGDRLTAALRDACDAAKVTGVCVAIARDEEVTFASVANDQAAGAWSSYDESEPLPVACLAKPLTATILANVLAHDAHSMNASVTTTLRGATGSVHAIFDAIQVHQLLDHTHGLDGSLVSDPHRSGNGRIDLEALARRFEEGPRISAPHERLFSYGNAGSWIAAALAEILSGRNYVDLAREIFPALPGSIETICAARGDGLTLSMVDIMRFLKHQMRSRTAATLRAHSTTFPGWCPPRNAACCGWYEHGDGWYGHNGVHRDNSLVVRFNPARRVALAIAAAEENLAKVVTARLFAKQLPELNSWPRVARLGERELAAMDLSAFAASYGNAMMTAAVNRVGTHELQMRLTTRSSTVGRVFPILPARAGSGELIFMLIPNQRPFEGFVQFVGAATDGRPRHLWDGRMLLPRLDSASH